jgi:single-strand DNA-binding protein
MSSVNKVTLIGNVGKDPEVRRMSSGDSVVNFSIATSERWKGKDGSAKEKTEWHNVVVFDDRLAKVVQDYVHKGSKLYLEGQLQTRKWTDKNGVEKYTTEVVLQKFRGAIVLLDGKPQEPRAASGKPEQRDLALGSRHDADLDDEIPF